MLKNENDVLLSFLPNVADINQGLGDAGIETFRDSPYASLARECAQNSTDARLKNPVTVSFDMLEIAATQLPSLDSFRSSISCCLQKAKDTNTEKEVEFFANAKKSLDRENIKILRISDSNTKGLEGPCRDKTPFHSLLKGSGVSIKDDATSGGSFGIGKNAAFAISDIQTVFYSTQYRDGETGDLKFLCQGKSVLVSHTDKNNIPNLATGYWGQKPYMPVTRLEDVPEWLRRSEIGTSVFCIACRESPSWEAGLAASLIQNFFCAIYRNETIFSVNNGGTVINKDTLISLFGNPIIKQAAADNGHEEDFEFARALCECLMSLETKEEIVVIPELGKVAIRILVREGLPKRVSIIRNGMYITDNLENFGEKFRRFPLYKDFVTLVEPIDHDGITFFKNLENPRHDGFSSERIPDTDKRNSAARVMKQLAKAIRDAIKSQSLESPKDSVTINELSEFFADQVDPEKLQDPNAIDENPEILKYKPSKKQPPKSPSQGNEKGGDEGGSGTNDGKGGDTGGSGSGSGGGTGGAGNNFGGKTIALRNVRNLIGEGQSRKRQLILTPEETATATVAVFAAGVNSPERLRITGTDAGEVASGSVKVNFTKDKKLEFTIEFSDEYDGPIEVIAKSFAEREAA
ncbi:hypothetical protein MIZ01_2656 [Sideroxyarcus emersonii]|uniref:Uncharacterized protein n=1 Tax=Sideroxyarcus emersonii TaxID=2764705 RepID=A0AAN1XC88_9PROT|nr:hypothetical protein [Sideroxyarcus emersonii]BCK88850.1 hypothetical protein MIZ01_2656 [Sideroxyarcus emersonii]